MVGSFRVNPLPAEADEEPFLLPPLVTRGRMNFQRQNLGFQPAKWRQQRCETEA